MSTLLAEEVEKEVINIITDYCQTLEVEVPTAIDSNFVPGHFIKSDVLLTAIGDLAAALKVEIPVDCYVFYEKNERRQLSIKETVAKILRVAVNENEHI